MEVDATSRDRARVSWSLLEPRPWNEHVSSNSPLCLCLYLILLSLAAAARRALNPSRAYCPSIAYRLPYLSVSARKPVATCLWRAFPRPSTSTANAIAQLGQPFATLSPRSPAQRPTPCPLPCLQPCSPWPCIHPFVFARPPRIAPPVAYPANSNMGEPDSLYASSHRPPR